MNETPGWYALALSADLDPGTSTGTRLFGNELVVWRDQAGAAHIWEDRCPHRGMRLSFGFVRGDHIACLYHGWQYDTAGQCRYIPAHPDLEVSPMIRTRTYRSVERSGLIWVAWETESDPPPETAAESLTVLRSLTLDVPAARLPDAFAVTEGADGLLRGTLAGLPVRLAVQPLAPAQSAAHILLDGPSDAFTSADRARAAHACAALRSALEMRAAS